LFNFYKYFQGLPSQAKQALKQHLTVSNVFGYDAAYLQQFVKNMKLISEIKVEKEEDLTILRSQLHDWNDPVEVLVIVFTFTEF
jgi:hypothetical protein